MDCALADGEAPFGESDEAATEEQRQSAPTTDEPAALTSPEAAEAVVRVGAPAGRDARAFPGASGSAAAAVVAGAEPRSAGLKRAMTASAAENAGHPRLPRPSSSLLAKKDAAIAAAAGPETARRAAQPVGTATGAGAASSFGRRRSDGGLLAGRGGCRAGGVSRLKTKSGMRVLLPGQGARDYASLLKGSGTLRGRELEARVATAEAEVGCGICRRNL